MMQEVFKDEMQREKFSGVSDQYLILDSFLADPGMSDFSTGRFYWNIHEGMTSENYLGTSGLLENIIEMDVRSFVMPILPTVAAATTSTVPGGGSTSQLFIDQSGGGDLSIPQIAYGERITMGIKETNMSAFSDNNSRRHHFEFSIGNSTVNNIRECYPIENKYIFTNPVTALESLTLQFNSPDQPLIFNEDTYYVVTGSTTASTTAFHLEFTRTDHKLEDDDRIYISGFNSGLTAIDNYVNRIQGHPVFYITDDLFSITPTPFYEPGLSSTCTIRIAKNRFRIPIRLRKLTNNFTQGKLP